MSHYTRRIRRRHRPFRGVWRKYQAAVEHEVWCAYVPNNIHYRQIADECEGHLAGSGLPRLLRGTTYGPSFLSGFFRDGALL